MLPVGMLFALASYAVGSWGYILVKGYNITLREWVSPLHPFTGALDSNGCVPQGSVFPKAGKGGPCTGGGGGGGTVSGMEQKAAGIARKQNRPVPSGPGSRL